MFKKIVCLLILFITMYTAAQDVVEELSVLFKTSQYDRIIKEHAGKSGSYPAKALYFIGYAYFMKEDDGNCLKFLDLSLEKDPADPMVHFVKASAFSYMNENEKAVSSYRTAISLKPDDGVFYSGLADVFLSMKKFDSSLHYYQKATAQENCPPRPFSMIGQVYTSLKQQDKALEAFYKARTVVPKTSDSYMLIVYNIGLLELLKGNDDKAEPAFLELLSLDPEDYQAQIKLVQVYYKRGDYEKAKLYKGKLYEAQKQGMLKGNFSDKFCFDQFKWKDKTVMAYERYEEPKQKLMYKHVFYIVNEADETEFTIQTEYSPILAEMGNTKYLMGMTKGNTHYTYGLGFTEEFKYEDLKKSVIEILEGKHKPMSSSTSR